MTRDARIAAGECVRLMALLAESGTPHSKELALIIGIRLLAIVDEGAVGDLFPDSALEPWIKLARSLEDAPANASKKRRGTKSGSVMPINEGTDPHRGSQK